MRRSRANEYLQRICSRVREKDHARAVEVFVHGFCTQREPLRSIAMRLGVAQVIEERLPFDGGIFNFDGVLIAKVNSLCGPARRRFTLAHEVGHLILAAEFGGPITCARDQSLEKACDAVAAELLMPAEEVVPFVKRQGESSPEKLRLIAEAFGVSLHAAALRVHEDFKLWRRSIGLWHFQGSARELWFVGKRRWRTTRPPFRAFERALMSSTAIEARESFWEEGSVKPVCIELLSLGNQHLLGLVA